MRYTEIKLAERNLVELVQNPTLANPDTMNIDQALQFIDVQSETLDDALKKKVFGLLQKFKAHLMKQPVSTTEGVDEAIDAEVDAISKLLAETPRDPNQTEIEFLQHVAKLCMQKGAQIGHTELNKIKAQIEELYAPLANKIEKGGIGFAPEVELPDNKDDPSYADAQAYAAEMAAKRSTLSKTGEAIKSAIADMTNAVMEKAGRTEDIKDAEIELKRIYEFLEKCVNQPFINFDNMIKKTHGTVESEFGDSADGQKYMDIYKQFGNILGRTIDKAGAGAWGPGELGLLMLANPVRKGTKGDIETGSGVQVEVKASKKAGSGARLNVESATKGDLTREYNIVLTKYFGDTVFLDDKKIKVQHQTEMGQINFTIKGFNILNRFIDASEKWSRKKALQFLVDSVNIPMRNYVGQSTYDKQLIDAMSKVITKEGKFSFQEFQTAYTKLLFSIYQSEMLDCILVINPILGTFLVMNDPSDVGDAVNRGLVISGGIDFKDKQSTKSPQIGVGKIAS